MTKITSNYGAPYYNIFAVTVNLTAIGFKTTRAELDLSNNSSLHGDTYCQRPQRHRLRGEARIARTICVGLLLFHLTQSTGSVDKSRTCMSRGLAFSNVVLWLGRGWEVR